MFERVREIKEQINLFEIAYTDPVYTAFESHDATGRKMFLCLSFLTAIMYHLELCRTVSRTSEQHILLTTNWGRICVNENLSFKA